MPFIRVQKLRTDREGNIVSGSAAIMENRYVPGAKYHSRHVTIERLGRVVWLAEDKKSGIFLSSTRGLVLYDAHSNTFSAVEKDDPRIRNKGIEEWTFEAGVYKMFGDAHWLLSFLVQTDMSRVIARTFPDTADRVYVHLLHLVLSDGSNLSCENFAALSLASTLFPGAEESSPENDASFFRHLGDAPAKHAFFKNFLEVMRRRKPTFGRKCHVHPVILSPDTRRDPLVSEAYAKIRLPLALVVDRESGLVVWYELQSGKSRDANIPDTIPKKILDSLGIDVVQESPEKGAALQTLLSCPARDRGIERPDCTACRELQGCTGEVLSCAMFHYDDYMRDLFLSRDEEELAGRILAGIISANVALLVKHLADEKKTALTDIIGKLQSLMGVREGPDSVLVEMPGEHVRQIYQYLEEGRVPARLPLDEFRKELFAM